MGRGVPVTVRARQRTEETRSTFALVMLDRARASTDRPLPAGLPGPFEVEVFGMGWAQVKSIIPTVEPLVP